MDKATAVDVAEIITPLRQRKRSFFLVLIIAVLPLWSIVPLSWFFVIYSLRTGLLWSFGWRGGACFAVALCEVAFSIHHYYLAKHASGPSPLHPGNITELQATLKRVLKAGLANLSEDDFDEEALDDDRPGSPAEEIEQLQFDDPRAIDFRNYLRVWFGRVAWSSIRTHQIYEWLYWSSYNAVLPSLESIPASRRKILDDALSLIQKRAGCIIPEGNNHAVKPILLTLDEFKAALWRPFVWYAGVGISNWILKRWYEYKWDLRCGTYNSLDYLVRVPRTWNPATGERPIVFWHGLGLGPVQYNLQFIDLMSSCPDRPLLVPLQPHISQDIFHPRFLTPMGRHETVKCMVGLIEELGWVPERNTEGDKQPSQFAPGKKGVTMVSHSNGSYPHAWMLKAHPEMVASSCFVDPVTFCSWEGDVCYNFIYRPCTTGTELIMRYFVSTELGVANLLQRHFDWSANALWYEDIPNARDASKSLFVVGGRDSIMNANRVKRYLNSHGVRKGLVFEPNGTHGQALHRGQACHSKILCWLKEQN